MASDSLLVKVQGIVERADQADSARRYEVAYTLPRVKEAAEAGAVESCVVTDDVFTRNIDEEVVVDVLNTIEQERRERLPLRFLAGDRQAGRLLRRNHGNAALFAQVLAMRGKTNSESIASSYPADHQVLPEPPLRDGWSRGRLRGEAP